MRADAVTATQGQSPAGTVPSPARGPSVLVVSSFVLPHAGGVEEFVGSARRLLEERGLHVRVLACRLPGLDGTADAVVPARFLGRSGWPLPTGGLTTLWRELSAADLVLANNARHLLPVVAVLTARLRGRPALLVVHGSAEGAYAGGRGFGPVRALFQATLGKLAVRASRPVSVSRAGVEGVRRLYGAEAAYLPFPLRPLQPAPPLALAAEAPLRIAWVGRLSPEKDPLRAVEAVDLVRRGREAELHVYGEGPLRGELVLLALERPWLVLHGAVTWENAQEAQAQAHVCLSTSVADNVQVALLEPLSRGIPCVSTRIGDALSYYERPKIRHLCVAPADAAALADAILDVAGSYARVREEFSANAAVLKARHSTSGDLLAQLAASALPAAPLEVRS
jgi:glycosyltransferase involved in cell wall biosynthesis